MNAQYHRMKAGHADDMRHLYLRRISTINRGDWRGPDPQEALCNAREQARYWLRDRDHHLARARASEEAGPMCLCDRTKGEACSECGFPGPLLLQPLGQLSERGSITLTTVDDDLFLDVAFVGEACAGSIGGVVLLDELRGLRDKLTKVIEEAGTDGK